MRPRSHRRTLAVVAAGLLVVSACSSPSSHKAAASSATTTVAYTSQKQLVSDIETKGLTPARAELYFSLLFGALPGVSVKGIATDPIDFDGTLATNDIYREWGSLSPAQRKAVAADLKGRKLPASSAPPESIAAFIASAPSPAPGAAGSTSTTAPATSTTPSTTTSTVPASTSSSTPTATTASARVGVRPRYELTSLTPAFTDEEYVDGANAAMQSVATRLGLPPIKIKVIVDSDVFAGPYAETHLYGEPWYENTLVLWPDGCHITVFDQGAKMQAIAGDLTELAAVLVHESTHCFQDQAAGSAQAATYMPGWIAEGEATWVMAQVVPEATVYVKCWAQYISSPEVPYVQRAYDGVGLFGHEGDLNGQDSVWGKLMPMVKARAGGSDTDAWNILIGDGAFDYYSSWGASYFLDATNETWTMQGPGQVPTSGPSATDYSVGEGDSQFVGSADTYQAVQSVVDSDADILVVGLGQGYGSLHDGEFALDTPLDSSAPQALCLKEGGCTCPDGSPGASISTEPATAPVTIGADGGDTGVSVSASGLSLDDFCKDPDKKQPTPDNTGGGGGGGGGGNNNGGGGGGGGGGGSFDPDNGNAWGDPHLQTFDGTAYDFQHAGEFTLAKSTKDKLDVQVRIEPAGTSATVAVDKGVAADLDGHRVSLQIENGASVTRLDGSPVTAADTKVGGGDLRRVTTEVGGVWLLTWPDGTVLRVAPFGAVAMDLHMIPSASRAGALEGLFGNDNGKSGDDFALPGGTSLGAHPSASDVQHKFADSWRITQADSLFDYAPGQSTTSFTDTTFPSSSVDSSNVPGAADAKKVCQEDGITDPQLLKDCIVDAATIKDYSVLGHYAHAQAAHTSYLVIHHLKLPSGSGGATASSGTTPTTNGPGSPRRALTMTGDVADENQQPKYTFPMSKGEVVYAGPSLKCDVGGNLSFAVLDPHGKVLGSSVSGCLLGRFVAQSSGTYALQANPGRNAVGHYVLPFEIDRPDVVRSTSYGKTLSGTIDQVAAHDVYRFTAKAGDTVHIYGDGCNLGFAHPQVVGQEDNVNIDTGSGQGLFLLGCEKGAAFHVQQSGTYQAVVNVANVAPLTYHFVLQR